MNPNAEVKHGCIKATMDQDCAVRRSEGMDDPTGNYIFSLGKRVDKLERDVEHLEGQPHSNAGGGIQL